MKRSAKNYFLFGLVLSSGSTAKAGLLNYLSSWLPGNTDSALVATSAAPADPLEAAKIVTINKQPSSKQYGVLGQLTQPLADVADRRLREATDALKEITSEAVNRATQSVDAAVQKSQHAVGEVKEMVDNVVKTLDDEVTNFPNLAGDAADQAASRAFWALINPKTVLSVGGGAAFVSTCCYATYLAYLKIKPYIISPNIVLPESNTGLWTRLMRKYKGYKSPDIIYPNNTTEHKACEIIQSARRVNECRNQRKEAEFRNVLLHGPPGTGKTLFARKIADGAGMNFVIVTSESLLQGSGVDNMKTIIDNARRSRYGTVIFIDEVETLFINRAMIRDLKEHQSRNHILALLNARDKDFMVVGATNFEEILDEAAGERLPQQLYIALPNEDARKKLIAMIVTKKMFNTRIVGERFAAQAKSIMTVEKIDQIAQRTEGLSARILTDMVQAIADKALVSADGVLTDEHIEQSLHEALLIKNRSKNKNSSE